MTKAADVPLLLFFWMYLQHFLPQMAKDVRKTLVQIQQKCYTNSKVCFCLRAGAEEIPKKRRIDYAAGTD